MPGKTQVIQEFCDAERMTPDKLGLSIRLHRKHAGMTQRSLAQMVGVSQSYISQLEDGRSKEPSVYVVQRLAHVFGVSIDDLL